MATSIILFTSIGVPVYSLYGEEIALMNEAGFSNADSHQGALNGKHLTNAVTLLGRAVPALITRSQASRTHEEWNE